MNDVGLLVRVEAEHAPALLAQDPVIERADVLAELVR
jgi:hypothetical protein